MERCVILQTELQLHTKTVYPRGYAFAGASATCPVQLHPPAIKVGVVVLHTSVILQSPLRKAVSCNNREDRVIIEKKIMENILCNIRK
jgi:hypothetical protein